MSETDVRCVHAGGCHCGSVRWQFVSPLASASFVPRACDCDFCSRHRAAWISDPAGATIQRALPALGFDGVADVRVGKAIRFTVEAADEAAARKQVDDLCERMLANPVIESYRVEVDAPGGAR